MKERLLLVGLGLIGLAVLIALGLSWLQPAPTPRSGGVSASTSVLPAPLRALPPAREAYAVLIQQWGPPWNAADAGVVSLSATIAQQDRGTPGWSFQLYAPAGGRIGTVLVQGQGVQELQSQRSPYTQTLLDPEAWIADSPEVLEFWWAAGGRQMWQASENATLSLHLGRRKSGALTWQLVLLSEDGQVVDVWEYDAQTGARILTQ